jgi:hypothetical protein
MVFEKGQKAKPGTTTNPAASGVTGEGKGSYPEPKPDIQASLVSGLPAGIIADKLPSFKKFYGSVTMADLAEELEKAEPGNPAVFVLEAENGG